MLTWFDTVPTIIRRFMLVSLVHRSSDEAYQRVQRSEKDEDEELFRRLLDHFSRSRNEICRRQRRTNFDDPDGDVWEIDEATRRYGGTLGSSTVQQIERQEPRSVASFFALSEKGEANGKPGFGGKPRRTRELRDVASETRRTYGRRCEQPALEILLAKT